MDKVQKPSKSACYAPTSEPFRFYSKIMFLFVLKILWEGESKFEVGFFDCKGYTTSNYMYIYRVSQEECARLREGVPYGKV
jgi:hypothetical protein